MSRIAVRELDDLPSARAAELLRACCGAARWVEAMVGRRPFESCEALLAEADDAWWSLDPDDWREAFAHHPRIGESHAATPQSARAAAWSASEQAGAADADDVVRQRLADMNRAYEARFGHVFIVCATGSSAGEMLTLASTRIENDPETELRIAAEEQRKITRLRLQRLFVDGDAEPAA